MRPIVLLLALFLAACASKPYLPAAELIDTPEQFSVPSDFWVSNSAARSLKESPLEKDAEIRPGYLVRLSNSMDRQLNGEFRVDRDGMLSTPYQVSFRVAGLSAKAAESMADESYGKYFKGSPQIRIQVVRRQYWVTVQGLVQQPGDILVDPFEPLDRILAKAKGVDKEARYVLVERGQNRFFLDMEDQTQGRFVNQMPQWKGGEVLSVLKSTAALPKGRSNGIEFLGEVRIPGGLSFEEGGDFYNYLARAGGPTPYANLNEVQVIRNTKDGRAVTTGRADQIAKHIKLQPGDMVILDSQHPGQFEKNLQIGSLFATILSAIGIFILAL